MNNFFKVVFKIAVFAFKFKFLILSIFVYITFPRHYITPPCSRIQNHSINGQVTNRIPEATEMSILISPTKSKCSGNSDFNSQNNGYTNENTNNPSVVYQNNQLKNENNEECIPMLCQSNSRFKINSNSNNLGGKNNDNI